MPTQTSYTEEELIALISKGDQQAFAYLYDKYAIAISGIIYTYTKSQEDTEDVLQTCFIKIWNNFEKYDSTKGRLYTWMINIARNTSIDYLRSSDQKNKSKNQTLEKTVYVNNSDFQFTENYDHIGLNTVVKKLSEEHQQIIDLGYFKGHTQQEISDILNMPLGTVKTKIRQAMLVLRELLK